MAGNGTATVILRHCEAAVNECKGIVRKKVAGKMVEEVAADGGKSATVLVLPPDEQDLHIVYTLFMGMSGPGNEFAEGEFLVKMTLPKGSGGTHGYPFEPPLFTFMTPNGVYELNAKSPCVSIGVFHQNETSGVGGYTAGMKLLGFIQNIWGTFSDPKSLGSGIAVMRFDSKRCREFSDNYRQ